MDLLNQIIRQPVEPDYAVAATRGHKPARGRWTLGLLAVIIGALFAVAALQTTRAAPALQLERTELINRVQNAEHEQDQLRGRVTSLTQEIATLRTAALGDDDAANSLEHPHRCARPSCRQRRSHRPWSADRGGRLAIGQGRLPGQGSRHDLQVLANGLWEAGGEAISINGHRLSNLTAIRSAGDAITVDYRSLTRPYASKRLGSAYAASSLC